MKHIAIVMAAGKGTRMGTDIPKQFLTIGDFPVLYYSLKLFEDSFIDEVIIVTSADDVEFCQKEIVDKYGLSKVSKIVQGGKERYDSVYNGLKAAFESDSEAYVYIHDGARPALDKETLNRVRDDVLEYGSSVVSVPSKDTIKIADEDGFVETTPKRSTLWNIQTPQAFILSELMAAYEKMYKEKTPGITDDSMVMERYSEKKIRLTLGSYSNIKITTPEDLKIVEKFIEKN